LIVGSKLSLSVLEDQVELIDFWAIWCPPCLKEMPAITQSGTDLEKIGLQKIEGKSRLMPIYFIHCQ
jgi:thiol-disulfide isomerase/thioredoxin